MSVTEQDLQEIGLNIARLREACGMSQGELAEFMEVTTRCARDRIQEFKEDYKIKGGCVFRKKKPAKTESE